jgi:hypothetical protein
MFERRPHSDTSFRIIVMTYGPTTYSIVPPDETRTFAPPFAYPSTAESFPKAPKDQDISSEHPKPYAEAAKSILLAPSPAGWFYGEYFSRLNGDIANPSEANEILAIEHALFSFWPIFFPELRKPTFQDSGERGLSWGALHARSSFEGKSLLSEIHTAAGLLLSRILSEAAEAVRLGLFPPDVLVVLPRLGAEALLHQTTQRRIHAPPDSCIVLAGNQRSWTLDAHPSFSWNLSGP